LARLNLFFNLRAGIFAILLACLGGLHPSAQAINLHALYTASCHREIGVILGVTPRKIMLLNLSGKIIGIERFEIISYATYPLDVVPIQKVENPAEMPLVRIMTAQRGELVELIRGWPVDFSQDKVAFLTLRGSERLIERRSIWKVEYERELTELKLEGRDSSNYNFVHPYAFSGCPQSQGKKLTQVFPQQLMSDPVAIKRELDRLIVGHDEIQRYERDQQFYPVPEVYGNETSLGMWLVSSSRYGASRNRQNNFTPLLVNEYSSGPFGFQREFKTGAGPIPMSIHEEPQTQVFYRMKADYFHFSAMVDPGLLLVGQRYRWESNDLDNVDIRANDTAIVEAGFDYGRMAFEFHLGGATNLGARHGDLFNRGTLAVPKIGLRYQSRTWMLNVFGGSGSRSESKISILRANLEIQERKSRRFLISLIQRGMSFDGPDSRTPTTTFQVRGKSQTFAAYGYWRYRTRYWIGLMAALEKFDVEASGGGLPEKSDSMVVPKVGALMSLSF